MLLVQLRIARFSALTLAIVNAVNQQMQGISHMGSSCCVSLSQDSVNYCFAELTKLVIKHLMKQHGSTVCRHAKTALSEGALICRGHCPGREHSAEHASCLPRLSAVRNSVSLAAVAQVRGVRSPAASSCRSAVRVSWNCSSGWLSLSIACLAHLHTQPYILLSEHALPSCQVLPFRVTERVGES